MSIFPDHTLRILCETEGLVTSPDPERFPVKINPASIDVRVGATALVDVHEPALAHGETLILEPGEFALVAMLETVKLPPNVAANLFLKSSRAREGLNHSLAMWVDPGWDGILTMELSNVGRSPLILTYGQRVAQLVFHRLIGSAEACYQQTGRYVGDKAAGVQESLG